MADTVFREPAKAEEPAKVPEMQSGEASHVSQTAIEPPFLDYGTAHTQPFSVDYFDLGMYWNRDNAYTKEVQTIEDYLHTQVKDGTIANATQAVKERMKQLEKTAGVEKTDRLVVKVGKIAAYTKFLQEVKHYGTQ